MLKKIKEKIVNLISKRKNIKLEKKWRSRLKNEDFSIICSNCIGGTIYNRLGKQFLSPTINLWMTQRDFIKFAVELEHYISLDLEFIESEEKYPVALLGDIIIHFNHSETREDAEEKWNSRKLRINYNNIYIIMYYRAGYSLDEIREIEKARCKNLIVLTSEKLDLDYAYYIHQNYEKVNGDSFLDKDDFEIRTFEKQWDFVSWLNSEK